MELQYSDHKIWIENEQGKVVGEVDFVQRDDGNYARPRGCRKIGQSRCR